MEEKHITPRIDNQDISDSAPPKLEQQPESDIQDLPKVKAAIDRLSSLVKAQCQPILLDLDARRLSNDEIGSLFLETVDTYRTNIELITSAFNSASDELHLAASILVEDYLRLESARRALLKDESEPKPFTLDIADLILNSSRSDIYDYFNLSSYSSASSMPWHSHEYQVQAREKMLSQYSAEMRKQIVESGTIRETVLCSPLTRLFRTTWKRLDTTQKVHILSDLFPEIDFEAYIKFRQDYKYTNGDEFEKDWMVDTLEDVLTMAEIESKDPGIVNYLTEKHNIRLFGRYPEEMLLAQREENVIRPRGLILLPYYDINGAFSKIKPQLLSFQHSLEGSYNLQIFECQNDSELLESVIRASDRGNSKLDFIIMGSHSDGETLRLGNSFASKGRHELSQEELTIDGLLRKIGEKYLAKDAFIVALSCWAGKEDGLLQNSSSELGNRTLIGTPEESALQELSADFTDGKLRLHVKFTDSNGTKFLNGEKI